VLLTEKRGARTSQLLERGKTMTTRSAAKPIRAAVFSRLNDADHAVHKLLEGGFTKDQITVVCSDEAIERHFKEYEHEDPAGVHTGQGIAAGGAIGAGLGGFAVLVGVTTTGGAGLVAAGALLALGIAGPFIGAMMTRGIEKEAADFYDQALTRGQILVAVEDHSERRSDALAIAEKVFHETGAEPLKLSEG
jgi:hypothetical protein